MKGFIVALIVIACMLFPVHVAADTPNEFVEDIVAVLEERMHGRREELSKDPETLNALIDEVLLPRFDQQQFASSILREHWDTASEEQKSRFIDAFYSVLLHRYAQRLLDIELDSVMVLPFRGDITMPLVIVKTRVALVDGTNANVNYVLVPHDTSWWIIDVKIKGVSYVRNFRTQFGLEIDETGLDQLIARLEKEASGNGVE